MVGDGPHGMLMIADLKALSSRRFRMLRLAIRCHEVEVVSLVTECIGFVMKGPGRLPTNSEIFDP